MATNQEDIHLEQAWLIIERNRCECRADWTAWMRLRQTLSAPIRLDNVIHKTHGDGDAMVHHVLSPVTNASVSRDLSLSCCLKGEGLTLWLINFVFQLLFVCYLIIQRDSTILKEYQHRLNRNWHTLTFRLGIPHYLRTISKCPKQRYKKPSFSMKLPE